MNDQEPRSPVPKTYERTDKELSNSQVGLLAMLFCFFTILYVVGSLYMKFKLRE